MEFKVVEVSTLNKGFLVAVATTDEKRLQTKRELYAFDDSEKEALLDLIKIELNIREKDEV